MVAGGRRGKERLQNTKYISLRDSQDHRSHIGVEENRRSLSALSAGAYTTTFLVKVDREKGAGLAPPPRTSQG